MYELDLENFLSSGGLGRLRIRYMANGTLCLFVVWIVIVQVHFLFLC